MDLTNNFTELERSLYGDVERDAELEAELRSLEAEARANDNEMGPTSAAIDRSLVTAEEAPKEQDDEADDSVDNDEQLISELASLMSGDEQPVTNVSCSDGGIRVSLSEVEERIGNYNEAAKEAEASKNFGKLRRVRRGLAELRRIHQILRTDSDARFEFVPPKVAVGCSAPTAVDNSAKRSDLQSVAENASPAMTSEMIDPLQGDDVVKMSSDTLAATVRQASPLSTRMEVETVVTIPSSEGSNLVAPASTVNEKNSVVVNEEEPHNEAEKMDCGESASLSDETGSKECEREVEVTNTAPAVGTVTDPPAPHASANETEKEETAKKTSANGMVKELEARMSVYKAAAEAAQVASNSSKVRRMERIVKQYQGAIAAVNSGQACKLSELPVPPGFEPFSNTISETTSSSKPASSDVPRSMTPAQAYRYRERIASGPKPSDFGISACCSASATKSYQDQKKLQMMNIRLDQYKQAVLKARDEGNLAEAKELLKSVVLIKRLIRAFSDGSAVDLSLLPKAPAANHGGVSPTPVAHQSAPVQVNKKPLVITGREDIYSSLIEDLVTQAQICDLNIEFAKRTGDTSQVKFFENLRLTCKGDLIFVKRAQKLEEPPPKFRYETWTFPSLKSFPHISATEMEVHVCRALDIQLPAGYESKHADLYVAMEFAYPRDRPQVARTSSVKGNTSPVFDYVHKFAINPASRVMILMMKRHGVKFEVFQKGSLFRSMKLIGSAELKLWELESECKIEETLTLMANKKVRTGKLIVRVLIREPLVHKSADISRNWLIIDQGEL